MVCNQATFLFSAAAFSPQQSPFSERREINIYSKQEQSRSKISQIQPLQLLTLTRLVFILSAEFDLVDDNDYKKYSPD